jgi:hypothetical protein
MYSTIAMLDPEICLVVRSGRCDPRDLEVAV